jgi:chemotaxis protein methyltransferase CheR
MLTDEQFDRTRRLALQLTGIKLFERHRELLDQRSRRLEMSDPVRFEALLHAAEDGDYRAGRQLIGLLTTNFTGFFRHPRHFQIAADHALRAVGPEREARLWSAAAATGEEPYSLAMALIEVFRRDDPLASVLATDVDGGALAEARRGEYDERAVRPSNVSDRTRRREGSEVPATHQVHRPCASADEEREKSGLSPERCARFFTRMEGARWSITPAVRRLVEFSEVNLAEGSWPVAGPFDVIFCRNVLMYLEASRRRAALEHMASLLAPDGLLMLDPTEHLGKASPLFTPGADGVFSLRCDSSVARRDARCRAFSAMNMEL